MMQIDSQTCKPPLANHGAKHPFALPATQCPHDIEFLTFLVFSVACNIYQILYLYNLRYIIFYKCMFHNVGSPNPFYLNSAELYHVLPCAEKTEHRVGCPTADVKPRNMHLC